MAITVSRVQMRVMQDHIAQTADKLVRASMAEAQLVNSLRNQAEGKEVIPDSVLQLRCNLLIHQMETMKTSVTDAIARLKEYLQEHPEEQESSVQTSIHTGDQIAAILDARILAIKTIREHQAINRSMLETARLTGSLAELQELKNQLLNYQKGGNP